MGTRSKIQHRSKKGVIFLVDIISRIFDKQCNATKERRLKKQIDTKQLHKIAFGMAEMAKTHPNDTIANNLARVSEKVAAYGAAWSEKLSALDYEIIRFYLRKNA